MQQTVENGVHSGTEWWYDSLENIKMPRSLHVIYICGL